MFKVFVSMLVILLLSSCTKVRSDKVLEKMIKIEVEKHVGGVLDFNKITHFKWNRLLILTSYSNIVQAERHLKVNLRAIEHSGIELRDDINQVVFFDGDKIAKMVEYPRNCGDFAGNLNRKIFNRPEAKFRIVRTNKKSINGQDWIRLEHD